MNTVVDQAATAAIVLPRINEHIPGKGIFRGVMPGLDGAPDYKLFEQREPLPTGNWKDALQAARDSRAEGQEDWSLPALPEAALLYAVAKGEHEADWYWTSEPYGSGSAWCQLFHYGNQYWIYQSNSYIRGCAVRREPIQ